MLRESAVMAELQKALSAKGLSVRSIPGKGRGLVTTRDFTPGEVIICEEPYSSAPNNELGPICDGCFGTDSLKKCSACRVAWYCGSMCQKSEWRLHKLECRALARLTEDQREMFNPTLRLVMRLLLKRRLQDEQVIPCSPTDNYGLVDALVSHMSFIDENYLTLTMMAKLVQSVLVFSDVIVDIEETRQIFSKEVCNAHSVYRSEQRVMGTGLYPVISLINHSCVPNVVLAFEKRVAFVHVIEPIAKGTEVSISYIETAATTDMRQKALKHYYFSCTCSRCTKGLQEDTILGGYRCKDKRCNGVLVLDSEKKHFACQLCGLTRKQNDIKKVLCEAQEILKTASACVSSGNYHDASAMYKTVEHLQLKICHSFSINLMQTRVALQKIMTKLKDWSSALTYCRLIIPIYHRVYPRFYPMLGVQYYNCGNLEWVLGLTEDALKSYTKAMDILSITEGIDTPLVKHLSSDLDKARAACKRLSHD